jgi:tryptophan 2,3-dioxygenase
MTGNQRPLEPGIVTDFASGLSYSSYLHLNELLQQQQLLSDPPHHDEMLFVIQHQVSELWMKLMIHELSAAIRFIQHDRLDPCFKILSRVKSIQLQLFEQWAVLETLTPSEYLQFRPFLRSASGFQSYQYRKIEFLLGNKNREAIAVFAHDEAIRRDLELTLESPSLYDEFLLHLARRGLAVPESNILRDWSQPHERDEALIHVFRQIYEHPERYWDAYEMCEKLIDIEEYFQLWRFRHLKTVERIIGFRPGTAGSSGAAFLKQALDLTFFPELIAVRTGLNEPGLSQK